MEITVQSLVNMCYGCTSPILVNTLPNIVNAINVENKYRLTYHIYHPDHVIKQPTTEKYI